MDAFYFKLFLLISSAFTVYAKIESSTTESDQVVPRYVVFPGLDAGLDEVAEWSVGYASPFNVFFGPKPYILGWTGEETFVPADEDEELEEEDIEDEDDLEEEEEEEIPDYDYEKV